MMTRRTAWLVTALLVLGGAVIAVWLIWTPDEEVERGADEASASGARSVLPMPPPVPSASLQNEPQRAAAFDSAKFLQSVREALSQGDLLLALERMKDLSGLGRDALQELLHGIDAGEAGADELDRLREIVVRELALNDPKSAADYAFTKRLKDAMLASLREWAARDFEEALAWSKEKGVEAIADPQLMAGLAEKDVGEAVKRIGAADAGVSEAAVRAVAETLDNAAERSRFMAHIAAQGDARLAQLAMAALTTAILDKQGFDAAAAYVESTQTPPDLRRDLVRKIALDSFKSMGIEQAERRANWLLEQSSPKDQAANVGTFVSRWAQHEPAAAGAWLDSLDPAASYRDTAFEALATTVATQDPGEALDWARQVEDERLRGRTMRQVYHQWHAREPQAAEAYLRGVGLDPQLLSK